MSPHIKNNDYSVNKVTKNIALYLIIFHNVVMEGAGHNLPTAINKRSNAAVSLVICSNNFVKFQKSHIVCPNHSLDA